MPAALRRCCNGSALARLAKRAKGTLFIKKYQPLSAKKQTKFLRVGSVKAARSPPVPGRSNVKKVERPGYRRAGRPVVAAPGDGRAPGAALRLPLLTSC